MKINKTKSRVRKGKEYFKYTIIIPNKIIDKLEWGGGDKLKYNIRKGTLNLKRRDEQAI